MSSTTTLQQFSYGFGYFPFLFANLAIGGNVQFLYTDTFRLDAAKVGFAWTIYSLCNAISEPTMGILSDKSITYTWNSKRIPFILYSFIPWSIFYYLIWNPSNSLNNEMLFYYLLICLVGYGVSNAMLSINWSSLFAELFTNDTDKTKVSSYKVLFSIFGLMSGIVLPPLITQSWKNLSPMSYTTLMLLTFPIITYFTSGKISLQSNEEKKEQSPFFENLKIALGSRSFQSYLAFFFFMSFANAIM